MSSFMKTLMSLRKGGRYNDIIEGMYGIAPQNGEYDAKTPFDYTPNQNNYALDRIFGSNINNEDENIESGYDDENLELDGDDESNEMPYGGMNNTNTKDKYGHTTDDDYKEDTIDDDYAKDKYGDTINNDYAKDKYGHIIDNDYANTEYGHTIDDDYAKDKYGDTIDDEDKYGHIINNNYTNTEYGDTIDDENKYGDTIDDENKYGDTINNDYAKDKYGHIIDNDYTNTEYGHTIDDNYAKDKYGDTIDDEDKYGHIINNNYTNTEYGDTIDDENKYGYTIDDDYAKDKYGHIIDDDYAKTDYGNTIDDDAKNEYGHTIEDNAYMNMFLPELIVDDDPSAFEQKLEQEKIPFSSQYEFIEYMKDYGVFPLSFKLPETENSRAVLTFQAQTSFGVALAHTISCKTNLIAYPLRETTDAGDGRIVIDTTNSDMYQAIPLSIHKKEKHKLASEDETCIVVIIDPFWGRNDAFIDAIKHVFDTSMIGGGNTQHNSDKSGHIDIAMAIQATMQENTINIRGMTILSEIQQYGFVPIYTFPAESLYERATCAFVAPLEYAVSVCDEINTHGTCFAFVVERTNDTNTYTLPITPTTDVYLQLYEDVYQRKVAPFCDTENGCSLIMCIDALWGRRNDMYGGLLDSIMKSVSDVCPKYTTKGGNESLVYQQIPAHIRQSALSRSECKHLVDMAEKGYNDSPFIQELLHRMNATTLDISEYNGDGNISSQSKCHDENCLLKDGTNKLVYLTDPNDSSVIVFPESEQYVKPRQGLMIQPNNDAYEHIDAPIQGTLYVAVFKNE